MINENIMSEGDEKLASVEGKKGSHVQQFFTLRSFFISTTRNKKFASNGVHASFPVLRIAINGEATVVGIREYRLWIRNTAPSSNDCADGAPAGGFIHVWSMVSGRDIAFGPWLATAGVCGIIEIWNIDIDGELAICQTIYTPAQSIWALRRIGGEIENSWHIRSSVADALVPMLDVLCLALLNEQFNRVYCDMAVVSNAPPPRGPNTMLTIISRLENDEVALEKRRKRAQAWGM